MEKHTFQPGDKAFLAVDAPGGRYSAFFEDDGETGYFYAVDLSRPNDAILDAVHIYNVANVVDKDRPSALAIVWSEDGFKCVLLINDYAHAAFDFAAERGFCRNNFPNFPNRIEGCWPQCDHSWSDDAIAWL
ncbi:MAG: DUF2251 domain-containing protein [Terracidiphilus sp.]|jgi:hypothetical protein